MTLMMVDLRCPQCNSIVSGREEVALRKTLPRTNSCPNCKCGIKLEKNTDDLGECYSFVPTKTATIRT